jgi:hypothetical protein
MLTAFAAAWQEYKRIFEILGNKTRDFVNGRGFREMSSEELGGSYFGWTCGWRILHSR